MRRIKTILTLLVLVLPASCFLEQLQASAQGQGQMLTGEGQFDMAFVQEYFKKLNHIDVAATPAPYPDTDTKANGHRSMLGTLNPEFRKRIDALVAIYQAFCRQYNENIDIGIVPISGALRTKEDQQELYKKGRHQVPGTDGTHQQDWQPAHTPNAVTTVWVGWHQLGMAVDFGHYVNGVYKNDESSVESTAWRQTVEAAVRLGLVPGFFWHSIHDPAHIEWHPCWDEGAVSTIGTPGVALTDAQVNLGYKWKLPEWIYKHSVPNPSGLESKKPPTTDVYHLVKDGDWIALKSMHTITGQSLQGEWSGNWTQFQPPARLFPAYIPIMDVWRTPKSSPDDRKWRAQSKVVSIFYAQHINQGTRTLEASERTGTFSYLPGTGVRNLQMQAMEQYIKNDPYSAGWKDLHDQYIYSIVVGLDNDGTQADGQLQTRVQDKDGYTFDGSAKLPDSKHVLEIVDFQLGWNHDTGEVGAPDITALSPDDFANFHLKPQSKRTEFQITTYTASLPAGALDVPKPMFIRKNPKPPPPPPPKAPAKAPKDGSNSFLRP
jgi:hypothetical protein